MNPAAPSSEFTDLPASPVAGRLECRLCGHPHLAVDLAPGDRAFCVRCDTLLARGSRFGEQVTPAFTIAGLLFVLPATLMPFVTVGKLGRVREATLFSGVDALWDEGMRLLAGWVLLCGGIVPILMLCTLAGLSLATARNWRGPGTQWLQRAGRALEHWAMPEVQVLAVLVALTRLGSVVDVHLGVGFWCYAAMSLALLVAWRGQHFAQQVPARRRGIALIRP